MTGAPVSSGGGKLVPLPPDGGWGWVVVLGSFFVHVFADGFVYSFGVLVETLMEEFHASNTMAALIISLLTGLTLGSGPLASAVCNKYGCRITTITGAGVAFVGCALSYFATAMWHIVITVGVIMGTGFGLMYCPAIVIVTMYFENKRSLATGIAVAGAGVGTVLFAPINAFFINNYGWRSVFLAFLFILVLCALCGATFAPLEFALVPDEEEEVNDEVLDEDVKKTAANEEHGEKATLLSPPSLLERSMSQSSGVQKAGEKIRPASSMGAVDVESQPRSRRGTVGERDSGYLNRKDVFYTGSISNVAEFREDPDKYRSTGSLHGRHTTVGSIPAHSTGRLDDVREGSEEDSKAMDISEKTNGTDNTDNVEGKNMFKTISNMLSLELLLEPTFLLFAISNLLTSVGFNSPLYFLPLHATKIGLEPIQGSKVLSAFGVSNTVGRIIFGVVADHKLPLPGGIGNDTARNRLWMYNISLTICGLLTVFCYQFNGFIPLATYSALFGFSIASYICLTSVILVDLLGLDKLTNAFGLLLLWQGVGTVFGPPVSGYLADMTGNYTLSFVFCGVNLLASGLMLFGIPFFQKKAKAKALAIKK
ncbi:Major facilitator superfamily (MFS) profile domain-containing protein [Caenorhabditis elegans]|uniref:Major facilitator superfamily (MFS) profile domain-containing protein n=1 Tax=Caenorhabditis elegans TaxID=6239 RepID=O17328_CAEEL|nr:Major facilitator superfamily (MFS) profile domain-containing protein [Caenorhabditis elegans]CCD64115.1 Major facilitator superfamily (MFS) profile domain-containing protein [Caenorhabditis elegans]|eukprot:NP_510705.1 MonoCarboxylate Transporter family [Caenorhabditis elegans]